MHVFHVITLFPESFDSYLSSSIMNIARGESFYEYKLYNLCDYTVKNTRRVDDRPYWWMPWTIIAVEPLYNCIKQIQEKIGQHDIIYLTPRGKKLKQSTLEKLAKTPKEHILICGHYEWIDERIKDFFKITELSIWDFVLTSWELAAMVLMDWLIRLIPWVLNQESLIEESFSKWLNRKIEYPQFTRPSEFLWSKVPEELLSWNPKLINQWKKKYNK